MTPRRSDHLPMRLFVGVYPPPETSQRLLEMLSRLDLPHHRLSPIEQVHLTLQFIGDRDERELDDVRESVHRSCEGIGAFHLSEVRLSTIPEAGLSRLIAAETTSPPELLELQRRLALRFARRPRDASTERFRPHLTLCRFAGAGEAAKISLPIEGVGFRVERVRLMRSQLLADRASHRELACIPLDSPA